MAETQRVKTEERTEEQKAASRRMMSRTLASRIMDLRGRFGSYAKAYDTLLERKQDLAKPFMQGFNLWKRETGRSFVAFVHELDPGLPADRDKYVNHRSYQAALYLRRLVEAPHTLPSKTRRSSRTPYDMLAIMIKSTLPFMGAHQARMWLSFTAASRWKQRDVERLQVAVKTAKPFVINPTIPRLVIEGRRQVTKFVTEPVAAASGERG